MSRFIPKSPSYQATMSGLLRLHQLTLDGQDESEAADLVRESMHEHWEGLSKVEKDRLTGLSKDLYEISDQVDAPVEPSNPQTHNKIAEAYHARSRGEWDRALSLLRRWGKYIPRALLSSQRGSIWRSLGEPAASLPFVEFASRLEPENGAYQATLLYALRGVYPDEALTRAKLVLREAEANSIAGVVYAADIVLESLKDCSSIDFATDIQNVIQVVELAMYRIEDADDGEISPLYSMIYSILATSYQEIGDSRKAYEFYSRAIRLNPRDDMLLSACGILTYGTDPNATRDFEEAIRLKSNLIWPYLYLAHHHLVNNRFEECRVICEQALHKVETERIKSQIHEFLAISLTALGYPEQVIRREFENAIRLNASSERAKRNFENVETGLATRMPRRDWERVSESSMRKFGVQETRIDPDFSERRKLAFA